MDIDMVINDLKQVLYDDDVPTNHFYNKLVQVFDSVNENIVELYSDPKILACYIIHLINSQLEATWEFMDLDEEFSEDEYQEVIEDEDLL